jgi:hypothetical protein
MSTSVVPTLNEQLVASARKDGSHTGIKMPGYYQKPRRDIKDDCSKEGGGGPITWSRVSRISRISENPRHTQPKPQQPPKTATANLCAVSKRYTLKNRNPRYRAEGEEKLSGKISLTAEAPPVARLPPVLPVWYEMV